MAPAGLAGVLSRQRGQELPKGPGAASFFSKCPLVPLFHCPPEMHH